MSSAFIIMQIGNPQLDEICSQVIVAALKSCGLDPKRVDKHNKGRLLKSEIIGFIQTADIIVAELTNERPNCYLEVGYAMGHGKFTHLILTAREDHNPDSPNYRPGGPKVHFDLSGYDVLYWSPDRLDEFREQLEKKIRRRQKDLPKLLEGLQDPLDHKWLQKHQQKAWVGLLKAAKVPNPGCMEVCFTLCENKLDKS